MPATLLPVEIAFVTDNESVSIPLQVERGTTVLQAIQKSGILQRFSQIDLIGGSGKANLVGIFGELKSLGHIVKAGDQVEIYRPLKADPMVQRNTLVKKDRKLRRQRREKHPW